MHVRPSSAAGLVVSIFGAMQLVMGAVGLILPDLQRSMIGLANVSTRAPGDYTFVVMTTTSGAAINMGILYLLGVAKRWPGFFSFTILARTLMCAVFMGLVLSGKAPWAFIGAGLWEGVGALIIAVAIAWDNRRGAAQVRANGNGDEQTSPSFRP